MPMRRCWRLAAEEARDVDPPCLPSPKVCEAGDGGVDSGGPGLPPMHAGWRSNVHQENPVPEAERSAYLLVESVLIVLSILIAFGVLGRRRHAREDAGHRR